MKLTIVLIVFLNFPILCQNLVPNPSFELVNESIVEFTENNLEFDRAINNWTSANTASPDLITPVFKEKYITPPSPKTGLNMIGIQFSEDHWVECVTVDLIESLIPNRTYYVEFWTRLSYTISPRNKADQVLDENFGILFSSKAMKNVDGKMLLGDPQITAEKGQVITYKEWIRVSGYFTPKTRYDKLYLGQFQKAGETPKVKYGYYLIDDVLVEELKGFDELRTDATLTTGNIIPLNQVHFKTGSTDLGDEKSTVALTELVDYLNLNTHVKIRINGHTDSVGNDKLNLSLSKKRAKFISQVLIENGIPKNRIKWKGFGELQPIAGNITELGRAQNRRVEFEIVN